jgi:predicted nucleic acid-binding protein
VGALLDSTFLINAERRGLTVAAALLEIQDIVPDAQLGISVISVLELAHGESRAESAARATARERFLSQLMSSLEIYPVTPEIARRAGRLDGELAKTGSNIAFPDLIIGVSALELGFSVVTRNLRHFQKIPGLTVVQHGTP